MRALGISASVWASVVAASVVATVVAISVDASAASFDCRKAAAAVEKMICGDGQLSELDGRLARSYRRALEGLADPAGGKTEVLTFKKKRTLIRKLGEIGLGDRWEGQLKVTGNEISIGKDMGGISDKNESKSRLVKVDFQP